jgi:hypothetical protein
MSGKEIAFPPLVNGLDFLESVVEHLQGEPMDRDLKYAILHLVGGTEVLLKARLAQEHWSLVFEHPGKATEEAWTAGEFHSCHILDALDRLVEIVGIDVAARDRSNIRVLIEKRNRLQHFGLSESAQAVQAVAIRVLNFLISFVTVELRAHLADPDLDARVQRIRQGLSGIGELVSVRLDSLAELLDSHAPIVTCPECMQMALEPGDSCLCHFCGAGGEPESVARQYLFAVLGEDEYSAAKGRTDWSLETCPECGRETLVRGVLVRVRNDGRDQLQELAWCCFSEGATWEAGELSSCMRCGTAIPQDDGPDLCADCLSTLIERF